CQDSFPRGGGAVVLPPPTLDHFHPATQIAEILQEMESRVESSRANAVAVPDQFLGNLRAIRRLLGGMIENVQTDEAVEEVPGDRVVGHAVGSNIVFRDVNPGKLLILLRTAQ